MQAIIEQQATTTLVNSIQPSERIDPQHYYRQIDPEFVGCRQQLLSNLISLSNSLDQRQWDIAETLLQRFCNHLTNYLTLGHERTERACALAQPDTNLQVAIASTSRIAMCFNDRYSRGTGRLEQVRPALEQLALALETRFELEDDLQVGALVA